MEYTQFDGEMEVDAFDNFVPDDGSPDEFDYLFGKTYREGKELKNLKKKVLQVLKLDKKLEKKLAILN